MSFQRTIKFILFAERTSSQGPAVLQWSRVLCGRTSALSVPQRSLYLSLCNNSVLSSKLVLDDEGIFKRTWKKIRFYAFDRAKLSMTGYFLYETIADKINYVEFFKVMSLPDTFNSWFLVTELHVWMLMAKSMEYGKNGRIIRNNIVKAMWDDVTNKAKRLGPENTSAAREQTKLLGDQFQAAIISYDEGILTDDRILASALWRRFFEKNCANAWKLEVMVKYVRQQMHYLDNMSEEDFRSCKIVWLPLDKT